MSPSLSSGEKVQASASRESIPPQLPTTALPITALMQKRRELRPFLDIEGLNIKEQDTNDEPIAKRYLNELGTSELPVNWRVLNFEKFCDIEGGNQPPKSQFVDEPRDGYVQLFQIRDLGERGVPTYIPIKSARSLSKEGDILIGRYGASVGKVFWSQNGAYNVAMAKFIWPHDAFISKFAFLLLKSDFLQGPLANATRSAQAGFNKGDLAAINFPLPPSPNNNASSLNTTS
jgi:type I restriction enzyme S subunit